ncbi:pyridoxal phosphate-dependent aminotransferase [Halorussus halophilus]|uniref:pyridoxal phosphate-dependent aminotransferase n=1 Tax=Halorussus halophilus TaxID=2650975 RepID=UPI001301077F|nr:pyridoxal phosphate-dependent aminotransferase [Halorussus halophilus]
MFPDIEYLDWITGRPERAEFDLGSSDLRRTPPGPDEVVPPALAGLPAPPEDVTVEALLADAYDVAPENVLVTAGATHANFLAVAATLRDPSEDEGDATAGSDEESAATATDRVLVEKPGYEPLTATPAGLGATVDRFRRPTEDDYALDPGRVEGAMTADTTCVTVTNRHNPSGRRVSRETLSEVARTVADADARLLVDEVYAPFGAKPVEGAFGGPTAASLPYTVVTNSLTKFFGFGGVRLGWLIADEEFVERAQQVKYHVPAVAEPSRRLARRALAHASELAAESRDRIRANHDLLAELVATREDVSGYVADSCPFAFLAHDSADGDEVTAAAWEADTLVSPGRFFDDPEKFRVGVCQESQNMQEAVSRFGAVADELD